MPDDQPIPWDQMREFITPDGRHWMPRDAEGNVYDVELRVVYRGVPPDVRLWWEWVTPPDSSSKSS